jgi:hypothetical protein
LFKSITRGVKSWQRRLQRRSQLRSQRKKQRKKQNVEKDKYSSLTIAQRDNLRRIEARAKIKARKARRKQLTGELVTLEMLNLNP